MLLLNNSLLFIYCLLLPILFFVPLQQTRIGRYVNEMRRKTSSRDLSKRAKNLVRKWKNLVGNSSVPQPHTNGERLDTHINSPMTHVPLLSHNNNGIGSSTPHSTSVFASSNSHGSNNSHKLTTPPSPAIGSSKHSPSLPLQSSQSNHITQEPPVNFSKARPVQTESLSKTNAANKKRRRTESPASTTLHKKHCADRNTEPNSKVKLNGVLNKNCTVADHRDNTAVIVNDARTVSDNKVLNVDRKNFIKTDAERLKASIMTPQRVKTTAQLIQDLSSKSGVNVANSETAAKIALNQIEKEPDPVDVPVVPPEARPRPRRKPGTSAQLPPQTGGSMLQIRKDIVNKFLATSVNSSAADKDLSISEGTSRTQSPITINGDSSDDDCRVLSKRKQLIASSSRSASPHTVCDTNVIPRDHTDSVPKKPLIVDPWELLPPINYDEIDWNSHDYDPPETVEVTEEAIDKLHERDCIGLNGQNDSNNVFHNWTETYSQPKDGGEHLHILPYVDI